MNTGTHKCRFLLDRYGRLGGPYSLADLPVAKYEVLTRDCEFIAHDSDQDLYEIRDGEKGFTLVIDGNSVEIDND